jgi:hypothetical protein
MLLLTSTSDLLQVVTDAAVNVDVHASFADYDGTAVTVGRLNTKISTATTTTVVASPAAATSRNVKSLHIANVHASLPVTVTLNHTDGTTVVQLESVSLLAGERISYREGVGMRVITAAGFEKVQPPTVAPITIKSLSADQSNSTVTPTNVVGLEIECGVGNWMFEYYLRVQSALTTTGHRFSVNHDGTVTAFMAQVEWTSALGTASDANVDQDIVTAAGGLGPIFAARAKSTAGWGTTLSVDTANADVMYMIYGLLVCTVAGNLELWHGSEVAAASTVKAGSSVRLTKTG